MSTNAATIENSPPTTATDPRLMFFRRHAIWLVVLAPYLLAWWLPFVWSWNRWTNPAYVLFFQPFVPVLAVYLAWTKRDRVTQVWKRYGKRSSQGFLMRGNALPFALGIGVLAFAHLVQIKGLAVIGLLLIAWGVVYRFFGARILKALGLSMAFSLLAVPPPDSIAEMVMRLCGRVTLSAAAALFRWLHVSAYTSPDKADTLIFSERGYTVDYLSAQAGLGVLSLNLLLLFCRGMAGGFSLLRLTELLSVLLLSVLLTAGLNLIRVMVAGMMGGNATELSRLLAHNGWILLLMGGLSLALSLAIEAGVTRAGRQVALRRAMKKARPRRASVSTAEPAPEPPASTVVAPPTATVADRPKHAPRRPPVRVNPFGVLAAGWKRSEMAIEKGFRMLSRRKRRRR